MRDQEAAGATRCAPPLSSRQPAWRCALAAGAPRHAAGTRAPRARHSACVTPPMTASGVVHAAADPSAAHPSVQRGAPRCVCAEASSVTQCWFHRLRMRVHQQHHRSSHRLPVLLPPSAGAQAARVPAGRALRCTARRRTHLEQCSHASARSARSRAPAAAPWGSTWLAARQRSRPTPVGCPTAPTARPPRCRRRSQRRAACCPRAPCSLSGWCRKCVR